MNAAANSPFHPDKLRLDTGEGWAKTPTKIKKRDEHFVRLPWTWIRRLKGATYPTWVVACHVLYLDTMKKGEPIKLANGMLKIDGVPPTTKRWALRDLEHRGLIAVEWRPRKSPTVRRVV